MSKVLTDDQLAELEAAEAAATPGPLTLDWYDDGEEAELYGPRLKPYICLVGSGFKMNRKEDFALLALARNNLRALIDEVRDGRIHQAECAGLDCGEAGDLKHSYHLAEQENQSLRAELEAEKQKATDFRAQLEERDAQLSLAKEALKAVSSMRNCPIVDDDFPSLRDRADFLVREALATLEQSSREEKE